MNSYKQMQMIEWRKDEPRDGCLFCDNILQTEISTRCYSKKGVSTSANFLAQRMMSNDLMTGQ